MVLVTSILLLIIHVHKWQLREILRPIEFILSLLIIQQQTS